MVDAMPYRRFLEWMVVEKVQPFGEAADYFRAGIIASTIANANRDPKKIPQPFKPEDFIPKLKAPGRRRHRQSFQEQRAILRAAASANNY